MHKDMQTICVTEEEINSILERLGSEITRDFMDKNPMFIGLLKGCLPFMTDLVKKVDTDLTLDYMKVSSYHGVESTGFITVDGKIPDVKGRHVIVVDDILDTGRTLDSVKKILLDKGAESVSLCVLMDKPEGRKVPIIPNYVGGKVPNAFVVGYGLDYNEHYRNLPFIGILKEEVYKK